MLGYALRLSLVFLMLLLVSSDISAHDSWILRGAHRNGAGEWCCGEEQVRLMRDGYHLFGVETVPFSETQPSPDGAFWRCKRPDGSRRCFFAPPPAT